MSYSVFKLLHILVLAAWLGLEIAVFMLFSRHRDYDIPIEGRRALSEVHEPIAFGPRVFWMPMLIFGIVLVTLGDWAFDGTGGTVLVVVASILGALWLAGQSYVFWVRRSLSRLPDRAKHLRRLPPIERLDTALRVIIIAGLGGVGVASIFGSDPIEPDWLAWKVTLFAVLVGVTLVWKRVGRRIAVERRVAVGIDQSRAPDLALFTRLTYQAQALLATFWVLMLVIIWLAIDKP